MSPPLLLCCSTVLFNFPSPTHADIYQWEYINPADPSQGKQQSTTLCPDGAGVDAVPGANLTGRDLRMAYLIGADLTNASVFRDIYYCCGYAFPQNVAILGGADLTAADLRGTMRWAFGDVFDFVFSIQAFTSANLIWPDGHIDALNLDPGGLLVVRDYDGNPSYPYDPIPPLPITIDQHLSMGPGGTLRMVFESDAWDSTISFAPGIPVMLGGTLELTFAADVNLASQVGRTFDLFDWSGVTPTGTFTVNSPYRWDIKNLYTTGEITLTAIPEPTSGALVLVAAVAIFVARRTRLCAGLLSPHRLSTTGLLVSPSTALLLCCSTVLFNFPSPTHADIYQWEYINPADPSQGKQQSTTLCPDGAGVDAVPGANLTGRDLTMAYLVGADLTGAFADRADLTNADMSRANLANTTFVEANLTGANFRHANLANVSFRNYIWHATLIDADLTAADMRGATQSRGPSYGMISTNLIEWSGLIDGLDLDGGGLLVVRDDDAGALVFDDNFFARFDPDIPPIPVTIYQHLTMAPGGTLRMVFAADDWDSTISFAPGIPVTLGGKLELTFADDVNLATQLGRTFEVFNWTGVHPTGAFTVASPYRWNLSNLYTTGEVTLTAVPEPAPIVLSLLAAPALFVVRRTRLCAALLVSMPPLLLVSSSPARADIFQWEYINPANSSQGKRQSATLAPDGAGVDAVPGVNLFKSNLTMAYLIGADLTGARAEGANLTDADLSQCNLTNATLAGVTLTDADFAGANIKGANFGIGINPLSPGRHPSGTGIALAQLYSTASYQAHDLSGIGLAANNLTGGNFVGQNLANASFDGANLTDADLTGANVQGAKLSKMSVSSDFGGTFGTGISPAQLYTTASYQAKHLSNIDFALNDLAGANFAGQNLSNASFWSATLTHADFTATEVRGTNLGRTGITPAQLYSTASYQAHDLSGIILHDNYLSGWNFAGQNLTAAGFSNATLRGADFREANLTNAYFVEAVLTGADFTGAVVRGARFDRIFVGTGISLAQLYSTASYQVHDLTGIRLGGNGFSGGNFASQNLTNADFNYETMTDADFTAADARGAEGLNLFGTTTTNLIWTDGRVHGLDLETDGLLVVRDYDGNPNNTVYPYNSLPPIPITVDHHLAMGPGGTLRMVFEADAWDSTISFAPGIPVTLGGTLELTFADDVNPASQLGRTIKIFDWTGVTPVGAFAVSSPYQWDLANLYTTGEVMLLSVPEPTSLAALFLALPLVLASTIERRPAFKSATPWNRRESSL